MAKMSIEPTVRPYAHTGAVPKLCDDRFVTPGHAPLGKRDAVEWTDDAFRDGPDIVERVRPEFDILERLLPISCHCRQYIARRRYGRRAALRPDAGPQAFRFLLDRQSALPDRI